MPKQQMCAAISAQTGKPCKRKAAEGHLVCRTHMGISDKQRSTLDKGRKKRHEYLKNRPEGPSAKERWAQLLSGTLTVKDLDDEEVRRMRVRGRSGDFSGRGPAVPSHLVAQFQAEQTARHKASVMDGVPQAIEALLEIIADDEHKDRAKIAQWFVERALGRTPEVIQHVGTSEFDAVAGKAIGIDRGVADGAEEFLAEQAGRKDGA